MSERAPYSRVYWSIIDDPKFAEVYDDDRALACWMRLLLIADQAWPASASLPMTTRKGTLDKLVGAGLIDLVAGGRYRVHGLDAERNKRKESATRPGGGGNPSGSQEGPSRDPVGTQTASHVRARLGSARLVSDSSSSEGGLGETDADDPAVALHVRTGTFPSPKVLTWLNEIADRHGEARITAAIRVTPMDGRTVPDYIRAVVDGLRAQDHAADKAERDAEKARNEAKRRPPVIARPVEDVSPEEADRIAREFKAEAKGRLS